MKASIITLDSIGEELAQSLSDIIEKQVSYRESLNALDLIDNDDDNLVFICGCDDSDFPAFPESENALSFYVRVRSPDKTEWHEPDFPSENTIYIAPDVSGEGSSDKYKEACLQIASEKIRHLIKLASSENGYIIIGFEDFKKGFSRAVFMDTFAVVKPSLKEFDNAVTEVIDEYERYVGKRENMLVEFYVNVPDNAYSTDVEKPFGRLVKAFLNTKLAYGLGFNNSKAETVTVTAAISYRKANS